MTAIAGCIGPARQTEDICGSILSAQDAYGEWDPIVASRGSAAFGCSLTQSLPEDEFDRQPLVGGDRFLIVADVRLDNREDLLGALGVSRSGLSDADIVLHSWLRWDERCLDRLVGDFAIAVWDSAERRLTLARDATGQRPLHYAVAGDFFAFATMPGALLAPAGFRNEFDFSRIALGLTGGGRRNPATYFRGIRRVLPGHVVRYSPSGTTERRHWFPPQDELRLSQAEFREAYLEHLGNAVIGHLRRDSGEIALHLSSGFDSSAVAAMAARLSSGTKPVAYTSAPRSGFAGPVPSGRAADESRLAAMTAQMHGVEHIVVRADRGPLTGLREYCRLYQEPMTNIVNMEWARQISAEAVRRGASILLTGEMGNLTINAGGLPALAELVRRHAWLRWWAEANSAARSGRARWRGILINSFGNRLPGAISGMLDRAFLRMPSNNEQDFVRAEWSGAEEDSGEPRYHGRYEARFKQVAGYDVGLYRKGALAEFGIHERDPLSDRRLLDFSFALPPEALLHNGEWRPLAQAALSRLIPNEVLNAPLRGYQGADWYERFTQSDARRLLEEISSSHAAAELLDLEKMRLAIDRWPSHGWAEARTILIYRRLLPIALMTGAFLQEFESDMAPCRSV